MLITVQGRLVRSHGSGETPFSGNGTIEYAPATHGTLDGALRGADPVIARVTDGDAEAVDLAPAFWRVSVFPEFGPAWTPFLVEITEDSPDPSQVADLAPVSTPDGQELARGYSAYEIAVQEGFTGTEQEWLVSLVGPEYEGTGLLSAYLAARGA